MVPPAVPPLRTPSGLRPDATFAPRPDPTRLTVHLAHCMAARGRLHHLRGALALVDGLVQPRFLSTLMFLALAATALLLLTADA